MTPYERCLIPLPAHTSWDGKPFSFGGEVPCYVKSLPDAHTSTLLEELWYNFTMNGSTLRFRERPGIDDWQMKIGNGTGPNLPDGEDYALSVTENGVGITGGSREGMLRGLFTLMQLIRANDLRPGQESLYIPGTSITDHPALKFRCLHLCVFPETTLPFLHKIVRLAGFLKFSHIVLEFWGMLRYDCLAELSWPRAYTKNQIRPIIADARSMGMEVIPMINHLGHASASRACYGRHVVLDQNPRLATLFEPDGWTWCLSNPETLALLRTMRKELMELCGPGSWFHIGCDEAYSFATCDKCSAGDSRELLLNYLNNLTEELAKEGRRPIMWGDMLLDSEAWAPPIIAVSRPHQRTHEILDRLDRRMMIADWQYSITEPKVASTEHFIAHGFDTVTCPWQGDGNIFALGQAAAESGAFGFMPTTWHTLPDNIRLMPSASEAGWCGKRTRDLYDDFITQLANFQRKVYPSHSDYLQSGFRRLEVIE